MNNGKNKYLNFLLKLINFTKFVYKLEFVQNTSCTERLWAQI